MAILGKTLQNSLFGVGADPALINELISRRLSQEVPSGIPSATTAPASPTGINQLSGLLGRLKKFRDLQPPPALKALGTPSVRVPGAAGSLAPGFVGPPAPATPGFLQQAIGPTALAAAVTDFGLNVKESQERRGSLSTINRHKASADRARVGLNNTIFAGVLGDVGVPERSISSIAANFFNTDDKKLRLTGFNDKQALTDLLFTGEHSYNPGAKFGPKSKNKRTITLDQFLQHAPPEVAQQLSNFRSSNSFTQADSDFSNINQVIEGFEQGGNPGKPDIIKTFIESDLPGLKRRFNFG